ncbi:hypothetical protein VB780_05345 [Leptolyngbya sp. CCNP1308]|uniref:hypothetical protein n=1 Tax=Leptolyngbya sp. CCNP1308 TaxID=3110255 RepID=UPI002B20759C|nr:hypothetical protein [Leptolyngbya sp. CCNP1308]MEA5447984.1 hypothetical protein [Leptolyngbya sp. CCNP1308]
MAFASATAQKIGKYLGYPADNSSQGAIAAALAAIEGMTDTTYSDDAIATIEDYLTTLDTLAAAILTETQTEGSTLVSELRREYRRHCALVAVATGLQSWSDTTGATQT